MFCSRKIKTLCCLKVAAAFMSLSLSFFFPLLELFFKFSLNSQEFLGCSWLPLNLASDEKYFILSYQGLSAERDDFWKTLLSTHLQNFLFSFFFMSILLWNSCFQLWLKASWIKCSAIIRKAVMVILKRSQPECRG